MGKGRKYTIIVGALLVIGVALFLTGKLINDRSAGDRATEISEPHEDAAETYTQAEELDSSEIEAALEENEPDSTDISGSEAAGVQPGGTDMYNTVHVKLDGKMNGVWVATVGNMDFPREGTTDASILRSEIDYIVNTCSEIGFNSIFLQVRPCSDAFYKSDIYPWSRYLTGMQGVAPEEDFDPLEYWISKAHENNIQLHAWVNPYRVTKENDGMDSEYNALSEDNPARQHPEYLIKYRDNYYFDPALFEVREMVMAGITEIVERYDVDGIHFDDYFYPGLDFDDTDSFALYGQEYSNKLDWRRDNVNKLVEAVGPAIKAIDPEVVFGISPSGIWANISSEPQGSQTRGMESYNQLAADTLKWAQENWIDYIAPQLYWEIGYSKADYAILADWWSEKLEGADTKLYIGIPDYRVISAGTSSVWYMESGIEQIKRQLELNDSVERIDGEIHFRFSSFTENSDLYTLIKEYRNEN